MGQRHDEPELFRYGLHRLGDGTGSEVSSFRALADVLSCCFLSRTRSDRRVCFSFGWMTTGLLHTLLGLERTLADTFHADRAFSSASLVRSWEDLFPASARV
jgi:hypothetical protein